MSDLVPHPEMKEQPADDFVPETRVPVELEEGEWREPNMSKYVYNSGKEWWKFGEMEETGERVRVYQSGAVKAADRKAFIAPAPHHGFIDTESSLRGHELRWEKARKKAAEGLAAAYMEKMEKDGFDVTQLHGLSDLELLGWMEIAKSRARIAMGNTGRDGTDAARAIGRWAGLTRDDKNGDGDGGGDALRIEVTGRLAVEALRALKESREK